MDTNELRIGNYVSTHNESLVIVDAINKTHIHSNKGVFVKGVISPIPLTEEWLLKFGFFEDYRIGKNNFVKNGVIMWKYSDSFCDDRYGVTTKHVHQLQNLYFALTGEELKNK